MSAINPLHPVSGSPTTASVRANFAAAADEIDDLVSALAVVHGAVLPQIKSASFTAAAGGTYYLTSSAAGLVISCPAAPAVGDSFVIFDLAGRFGVDQPILNPAGGLIMGQSQSATLSISSAEYRLYFAGGSAGWVVKLASTLASLFNQAAFSGSFVGTGVTLTDVGRTMQETRGGYTSCAIGVGRGAGKHLAEFTLGGTWTSGNSVGILAASGAVPAAYDAQLGTLSGQYAVHSSDSSTGAATVVKNGTGTASGAISGMVAGAKIGLALDCDAHTLGVYVNGVLNVTFTGIEAVEYRAVGCPFDYAGRVSIMESTTYPVAGFSAWT